MSFLLFIPLFFLIGALSLFLSMQTLTHLGRFRAKEIIHESYPFFFPLLQWIYPKRQWDTLFLSFSFSQQIYLIAYTLSAFLWIPIPNWPLPLAILGLFLLLTLSLLFLSSRFSPSLFRIFLLPSFLYTLALFPLTIILFRFWKGPLASSNRSLDSKERGKLREIIRESELSYHLDTADQKLIHSFVNFKERVANEIMVPRVDLFSLSSDTPIREATRLALQEGYSRIPIYKDTLDHIVGVVLYKDLLKCYTASQQTLEEAIETIAKPVLYAPENKKVSQLLQEFRSKQIHMAIIVDEYGGTEGIVTIEDILEELVGEIEDEYDIDEEHPFWQIPGGGWIIDAKMTLLDIADQIGIKIPTHPEYETLGGYVYHYAGTIPAKGWRLSHDEFELEVVSSNERAIKKIKLQPRQNLPSSAK